MEQVESYKEYEVRLGRLLTNMLSLETVLRLYLFSKDPVTNGHAFNLDSLKEGDMVARNYLTDPNFTLRPLIEKYNLYCKTDSGELCIDPNLADVRNALTHGRVLSPDPTFSKRQLFNFVNEKGQIRVSFATYMTKDWFTKQIKLFLNAIVNVQKCFRKDFPEVIGEIEWR